VELLVGATAEERLPELGELLGVSQGGVPQADEGPAHAALLRIPGFSERLRGDFIR
jgi:hypothetical protein